MSNEPEDEAVKKFELELETFGKRNKPKLKLVEDLTLCMRACNTPEMRSNLSEMSRKVIADLEKEMNTTNQKIQKMLEAAAKAAEKAEKAKKDKAAKDKVDAKAKAKQTKAKLKLKLDKFHKKLPSNIFIELHAKPKSKAPFVDPKGSGLSIGVQF